MQGAGARRCRKGRALQAGRSAPPCNTRRRSRDVAVSCVVTQGDRQVAGKVIDSREVRHRPLCWSPKLPSPFRKPVVAHNPKRGAVSGLAPARAWRGRESDRWKILAAPTLQMSSGSPPYPSAPLTGCTTFEAPRTM